MAPVARLAKAFGLLVLACGAYLLAWPVGLEPAIWQAPPTRPATGPLALNDALTAAEVFARTPGVGPDSLAIDAIGYVYTGLADGRILRIAPDGAATTTIARIDGRATGIAFATTGDLLVADERGGTVYTLGDDGTVVPLLRDLDGEPLLLLNDIAVGNDGTVYVTESSTRFTLEQLRLELLEHRPNGRILEYSPATRRARVLLDDLYFPNGIVVSPDQASLVFAETTAYRVSRLWLAGPKAGRVEAVLSDLPGFPGDVSVSENGRFWLSLLSARSTLVDSLDAWPTLRTAIARLPSWLSPRAAAFPYLIAFDEQGRVERTLQTTKRTDLPSFSSVIESGGYLYLGSPGIGRGFDGSAVYKVALEPEGTTVATPQ